MVYKLLFFIVTLFCLGATPLFAVSLDTERLAERISGSVAKVASRKYATVAFSRITGPIDAATVNELIDFTNVSMVKGREFRVVDRSKLQLILREQKFNLSGMVSQDTYKELGKLLGVDLFVYGRYYGDTLVMKAIDVESSVLVWADIFQITELSQDTLQMNELAEKVSWSLEKDLPRLEQNQIQQISFWNISYQNKSPKMVDFLSVAITKTGHFQVIDRENLQLILEEQKLNRAEFIDENQAKKMGELYGVDAFIYGKITPKKGRYVASLKLLNIFSGVIEWADLIRFGGSKQAAGQGHRPSYPAASSSLEPAPLVAAQMIFIPTSKFTIGSDLGKNISKPAFEINLKGFYIDQREVSNEEYAAYLKTYRHRAPPSWQGGKMPAGKGRYPVVMVSWIDADRYCKAQGKRLPKETEWEKAYRGTDGRKYPWMGKFEPNYARTVESGIYDSIPVTTQDQDISPYGVWHMAGNVREWVSSSLQPYPKSPFRSAKVGRVKVIRGGSWAENKFAAQGFSRGYSKKNFAWRDVGFRCAR